MTFCKQVPNIGNIYIYISNWNSQRDELIHTNFESGWQLRRKKWSFKVMDCTSNVLQPFFRRTVTHHRRDHVHHQLGIWTTCLMHQEGHVRRLDGRGRPHGHVLPSPSLPSSSGLLAWVSRSRDSLSFPPPQVSSEEVARIVNYRIWTGRERKYVGDERESEAFWVFLKCWIWTGHVASSSSSHFLLWVKRTLLPLLNWVKTPIYPSIITGLHVIYKKSKNFAYVIDFSCGLS